MAFTILPLYTEVETMVTGTAVRYINGSSRNLKDYTNYKDPDAGKPQPVIPQEKQPTAAGVF
jgi:hypothetical protein